MNKTLRRMGALDRLKAQLTSGVKQVRCIDLTTTNIPLTDVEISRIKAEIAILERRVNYES